MHQLSRTLPSCVALADEQIMEDADKFVLRYVDSKAANIESIRHWLGKSMTAWTTRCRFSIQALCSMSSAARKRRLYRHLLGANALH